MSDKRRLPSVLLNPIVSGYIQSIAVGSLEEASSCGGGIPQLVWYYDARETYRLGNSSQEKDAVACTLLIHVEYI